MKVIRILGVAHGIPTPHADRFLVSCDVDAHGGRGEEVPTDDPAEAMAFPDLAEAMAYWRRPSTVVPTRPDGKPNRPLTAYSIAIEDRDR